MIKSQIAVRAASSFCRPVGPGGEGARNPRERGPVLLVVPGVEIRLSLRRDVDGIDEKSASALRCAGVARRDLRSLKAKQPLAHCRYSLRPHGEIAVGN